MDKSEFKVGAWYKNKRFDYQVLAINGDELTVRKEDGSEHKWDAEQQSPVSREVPEPVHSSSRIRHPASETSGNDPMPWRTGLKRKMDYECALDEGRCWLKKHVPRLGVFDDCFPGNIGLGDVDGLVERNGCMLMLELKQPGASLREGQRIAYEQLSRRLGAAYQPLVIWGPPDFSGALEWQKWKRGHSDGPHSTTLPAIRAYLKSWFNWADQQRL